MSGHQDDAQELRRRLEDDIEAVLNELAPGWIKKGNTAYLTPKNAKDLGSFTVELGNNDKRGCFYRFSQSMGGNAIQLVGYVLYGRTTAYRESFEWTRRFFGIDRTEESPEEKARRRAHQDKEAAERAARIKADAAKKVAADAKRTLSAQQVLDASIPLVGTPGEAYLVARGIPPISEWPWNPDEVLRFHPALDFEPDRDAGTFPAVVCKVVGAFGELLGVWQIFLDRDAPQKADLMPSPKIGRGPATGGAIRIGGDGPHVDVCEGMETALGAWFLDGCRRPCWSLMSTSGMKNFEAPMFVDKVNIWKDGDRGVLNRTTGEILPPPGANAADALAARLRAANIKCVINPMTRDGDALDLWQARQKYEKRGAA